MFTTWLELHLSFAVYDARVYFAGYLQASLDGDESQVCTFAAVAVPLFTDFLYVAHAVALTFAMGDVGPEDGVSRRIVLLRAIVSVLFDSTLFRIVTLLMVG